MTLDKTLIDALIAAVRSESDLKWAARQADDKLAAAQIEVTQLKFKINDLQRELTSLGQVLAASQHATYQAERAAKKRSARRR